jgi:molybdenum cofactor cytidylyltransferase
MAASWPVCAIVLAAGRSERFGADKLGQRLASGESVLGRCVRGLVAPAAGVDGGVWIVGRSAEAAAWLGPLCDDLRVHWVERGRDGGQGDSLAAGVRALPAGAAVVVALGDQPFAAPAAVRAVVDRLRALARDDAAAIAAAGDVSLPPAAFGPAWRTALANLAGDVGARSLVAGNDRVARVDLGWGAWALDLDRPRDLDALRAAEDDPAWTTDVEG